MIPSRHNGAVECRSILANRLHRTGAGPQPTRIHLPHIHTFSALKYTNFRYLWLGGFFSSAGDWVQQLTLGWYIYELSGSAVMVGALTACRGLMTIVVGPMGGVLSDRMDRRNLMRWNHIFIATVAAAMAALVLSGSALPWHLFVFAALTGAAFALNNPLRQSLIGNTVPRESLGNAIGLFVTVNHLNRSLGPALGGILIALLGPGPNFLVQAITYRGLTTTSSLLLGLKVVILVMFQ